MYNIKDVLKKILVESQEYVVPNDLIERSEQIDLSFATGPVRKIYAICGLRRIGKTYYLYQLRKKIMSQGVSKEKTLFTKISAEKARGFQPGDESAE